MSAVVDASIAVAWCFDDEASPATEELLEYVRDNGAIVPGHWHMELANVLLQGEKRGRITASDIAVCLEVMAELAITTDRDTVPRAWHEIMTLARAERLTIYDAAYLELAMRRGLPLMTRDDELRAAAVRVGIEVRP